MLIELCVLLMFDFDSLATVACTYAFYLRLLQCYLNYLSHISHIEINVFIFDLMAIRLPPSQYVSTEMFTGKRNDQDDSIL